MGIVQILTVHGYQTSKKLVKSKRSIAVCRHITHDGLETAGYVVGQMSQQFVRCHGFDNAYSATQ